MVKKKLQIEFLPLVAEDEVEKILPKKAYENDAAWDCFINLFDNELKETYELQPHERVVCGVGFATAFPEGYYIKITPRSGLAAKFGIIVNVGTVDAGYRGEYGAIVINTSNKPYTLKRFDKICQIIPLKIEPADWVQVKKLPESIRGTGGFGSTGTK
jgi:dUTP pyrophosphatase